jgi:hypothetical protein
MVNIMKHLHVTDCAILALSCKHLARIAMDSRSLERDETVARDETAFWVTENIGRPRDFFARLQEGWVPKNLKKCIRCGKFQSMDEGFWIDFQRRNFGPLADGKLKEFWMAGSNSRNVLNFCKRGGRRTCPVCSANKRPYVYSAQDPLALQMTLPIGELLE